jgi:serine/threonine protein phosphatase PrpC
MKFSVFQVSRRGGREKNEDRMGYCYTRESGLFLLADGMGGHPEGEVAARMALQTMSALYQKRAKPSVTDVTEFLTTALMAAHHQIVRYASEAGMLDTPRTTLVAAVLQNGAAHWIHCGDSRLYVVRDGALLVRTRDHSYAEHKDISSLPLEMINRNILFTCLGSPSKPVFEVTGPMLLQHRDKIMLCSDGLWDQVSDAEIVQYLTDLPVTEAIPELVEHALRKAGARSDNVTALALEWETPDHFDSSRGISTDGLSNDVFATTIQAGEMDGFDDDLDDAAIERTIAEINEAIRRGANRVTKS